MFIPPSDLIKMPEGKTLEFKRDISSPKNILKTLVAFSNTAGGHLIIGIEDKSKEVLGISNPLDEEERLCSLIADNIAPRLVPDVEVISVGDKTLLAVEVYPSGRRPHFLKKEGPDEGVYVRLGSTNRKADAELIEELQRSVSGISYDEMPMPELSQDDLDLDGARENFSGIRELNEKELITLKLLVQDQGRLVPTNGAMLLFGKNREFYFHDAWVQCGRFMGEDKAYIFDHIDLHENLPDLVESVMLFLKKHAFRGADFSEIRRKDVWSIPLTILREAVINAIVHADYSQKGAPIRVSFFDDRIEIENPGILLPGMTVEDVKQGVSKIRNRVIARVFRELDLIEQWGSGFRRMIKEAEELGLPEPEIIEVGMRVRYVIYLKVPLPVSPEKTGEENMPPTQLPTQSPTQLPTQSPTQSSEHVQKLLPALADGNKSSGELRKILNIKHRQTFRENYIRPALDKGLIEMTIPERPMSSNQKYRLTDKGRKNLSELTDGE